MGGWGVGGERKFIFVHLAHINSIQSSIKCVDLQRSAVVKSLNMDSFCPSECVLGHLPTWNCFLSLHLSSKNNCMSETTVNLVDP